MMEGMLPEYGALGQVKRPTGGAIATAAPSNAYPTADGAWVLIAANSEPLFGRLMTLIGRPELIGTPAYAGNQQRVANVATLDRLIADWSRQHDATQLVALLEAADIPSSKVYTAAEIEADPQYRARRMVREVDDPVFGRNILQAAWCPMSRATPTMCAGLGPAIGAHTDAVLRDLAGFDTATITKLRSDGVVR